MLFSLLKGKNACLSYGYKGCISYGFGFEGFKI